MKSGFLSYFCLVTIFMVSCVDGPSAYGAPKTRVPLQSSGATTAQTVASKSWFTHVIQRPAPFYKEGPQQPWPADGNFEAGVRVKIIKDAGSYALVESDTGITAYVATADLKSI